jgi:hypothetical protein
VSARALVCAGLCACKEGALDTGTLGFRVVAVVPEDGATDVIDAAVPELRLSGDADEAACGSGAIRVDGLQADGSVAFPVDIAVVAADLGAKLQLTHALPFLAGRRYAITVNGACVDTAGNPIAPFYSTFEVP